MRWLNKTIKGFAYMLIQVWLLIQTYILSLIVTGCLLCMAVAILSFVGNVPSILLFKFWLVLLVGSIPLFIVFYIMVLTDFITRYTDWRERKKKKENK